MPTLRDRVRETLAAREPSEREAKEELDAVLARAREKRASRLRPVFLVPMVAAAAVLLLYLVFPRREPTPLHSALGPSQGPQPARVAARGVHLYLHVAGEPAERALTLDLDSKGDL